MGERESEIVRGAIDAIQCIAQDALDGGSERPTAISFGMTKLDLACTVRRMLHAELIHYLRCGASIAALRMISEAMNAAQRLLGTDDQLADDLEFVEPYRHHLYATVLTASLLASDREDIKNESALQVEFVSAPAWLTR